MKLQEHVIIIGNGIAGITAARHIRKFSDKRITVISAENEFFFARTALMYVYMGHLTWKDLLPYEQKFWKKNRIDLRKEHVEEVHPDTKSIRLASGENLPYDQLILATGSLPRKLGKEGEDLCGVQTLVSKQDLELLEENSRNCREAVIVGGGLIGVELAEMLKTRNMKVRMLIREDGYWGNILPQEDAQFISRHLQTHGVELHHNTELEKIIGDESGRVRAVITNKGEEFPCELLGLSVGVRPNIDFLQSSPIETERGILVDQYLRTNMEDIYAIGDCAQQRNPTRDRNPVEAVWYTARMMGETVAQNICGNPFPYNPGNWFNSAKFFDIEYQTYGRVRPQQNEQERHLHWEHSDGTKAVTLAFDPQSRQFRGINSFGIRMRHEVFDRWLTQGRSIEFVLQHLRKANFDPEFYDRYENEILGNLKRIHKFQ